jgi:hypothetical protein
MSHVTRSPPMRTTAHPAPYTCVSHANFMTTTCQRRFSQLPALSRPAADVQQSVSGASFALMSDNHAATASAAEAHGSSPAQAAVQEAPPPAPKSMMWSIARNMAIYFAFMYVIRNFTPLMTAAPSPSPAVIDGSSSPHQTAAGAVHSNAWRPGTKYDIHVWLSNIDIPSFDLMATPSMWRRTGLTYSDSTPDSEWAVNITQASHPELWSNVTLYAHVVMLRDSLKPERAYLRPEEDTSYVVWPLVKRYPERLANDRKKLLSGEHVDEGGVEKRAVQKQGARALLPHWVPELNVRVVFDFTTFQRGGIPPQLSRDLRLTHRGECGPLSFLLPASSAMLLCSSSATPHTAPSPPTPPPADTGPSSTCRSSSSPAPPAYSSTPQ